MPILTDKLRQLLRLHIEYLANRKCIILLKCIVL